MSRLDEFLVHHWALAAALMAIIVALLVTEMKRKVTGFKDIPPEQAVQMINRQNAIVLDVREDKDYRDGHIINALHIPLGLLESRINQMEKHKGSPIIVCCKAGQESGQAGVILRKQGYEPIYKLGGGITAWKNANFPVEK